MRGGTHRDPHARPELVDPGIRGHRAAEQLRSELDATAGLVFAQPLPGGVEAGPDESRSYADWLSQRLRDENDADA